MQLWRSMNPRIVVKPSLKTKAAPASQEQRLHHLQKMKDYNDEYTNGLYRKKERTETEMEASC